MFQVGDRIKVRPLHNYIQEHWNDYWKKSQGQTEEFGVFYVVGYVNPGNSDYIIYSSKPGGEGPLGGAPSMYFNLAPISTEYDPKQQPYTDEDI